MTGRCRCEFRGRWLRCRRRAVVRVSLGGWRWRTCLGHSANVRRGLAAIHDGVDGATVDLLDAEADR